MVELKIIRAESPQWEVLTDVQASMSMDLSGLADSTSKVQPAVKDEGAPTSIVFSSDVTLIEEHFKPVELGPATDSQSDVIPVEKVINVISSPTDDLSIAALKMLMQEATAGNAQVVLQLTEASAEATDPELSQLYIDAMVLIAERTRENTVKDTVAKGLQSLWMHPSDCTIIQAFSAYFSLVEGRHLVCTYMAIKKLIAALHGSPSASTDYAVEKICSLANQKLLDRNHIIFELGSILSVSQSWVHLSHLFNEIVNSYQSR